MAGLRRICRALGGMTVSANGKTVHYVWDYVADEPVRRDEMPVGSERHKASERAKYASLGLPTSPARAHSKGRL